MVSRLRRAIKIVGSAVMFPFLFPFAIVIVFLFVRSMATQEGIAG